MNKIVHSLLFKGVVTHLLLFVFLFVKDYNYFSKDIFDFFIYYFTSLIIICLLLARPSRMLTKASNQLDRLIDNDLEAEQLKENEEQALDLVNKVQYLGKSISLSKNNLESQRNQLDSILTYMVDGVIATDRQGNIILANTAAQNYLSRSSEELMEQSITKALHLDETFTFYELLEKEPEIVISSTNHVGDPIFLRVKFVLFRRESGFISGIIAVLHDKTDQEKIEREQKQFVSNVSHELRTPLTSVKAYLEALEDGALSDPEIAHSFIDVSLNETNRMIRMITDLLTLSRIDQERLELNKELINFVDYLDFQLQRLSRIAKSNPLDSLTGDFKFVTDFPDEPVWLEIDTDRMTQVIDNIIGNALKYSPEGGEIKVSLKLKEKQLILSISDQGMGIPKSDLPNIFKRFYRVDEARNSQTGGTGLGLSIVKNILLLHGGTIEAQSEGVGMGTSFIITLPCVDLDVNHDWDDGLDSDFE
ncbi:ATP-binding protein [Lactococcus sp.]|uniref:ATP-binding protein n=1 Tax=Lactococcus sp. TaxID=44273 RepID=UPI0035B11976